MPACQVLIDTRERTQLRLPPAPFDSLLRALAVLSAAADVPYPSLAECVEAAPATCTTAIELHAGSTEAGDVYEAEMLAAAVAASHAAGGGVSCRLTVHEGRDHNLVKEMRDEGELHALLRRVAGVETAEAGAAREAGARAAAVGIDANFVGFHDCGDI
jgi:hypothetical protein